MTVKYPKTPETDEIIRSVYGDPALRGKKSVRVCQLRIQAATGILWPGGTIVQRATILRVSLPRRKKLVPWTEAEEQILEQNAHRTPKCIAHTMAAVGFRRTPNEISIHRREAGLLRTSEVYTPNGLAPLMGVTHKTVCAWIKRGQLKVTARDPHCSFIDRSHIRDLLVYHYDAVDFGKIDKVFLIAILRGKVIPCLRKRAA